MTGPSVIVASAPFAAMAVAAALGGLLAHRLRIPGGLLTGALAATAVLSLAGFGMEPPAWLRTLAIAVIGIRLGIGIETRALLSVRRVLSASTAVTLALLAVVLAFALTIAPRAGIDTATAVLMVVPGGVSFIAALSIALGAEAPLVVVTHLIRMVVVVTTVPLIASRLPVTARQGSRPPSP